MGVDLDALRVRVHAEILALPDAGGAVDESAIVAAIRRVAPLLDGRRTSVLLDRVFADVHGLGPLEVYLADSSITDVMVVGERGVWIERNGCVEDTGLRLRSSDIFHLIERVVAPLGLRVDRASPMVDARLADGSRVNAIVPPLAVDGPCLTIRRFSARPIDLDAFVRGPLRELLVRSVRERRNILISGGTGAGKTTLLNALAQSIGESERVITIEDAAELRLSGRHTVRLESRPANAEGVGRTTLRDLVRNALRMRPDRIVLGEVRGAEALDMLQAMNTGHDGSLSTCHANSPLDALARIETMTLMADVGLPLSAVREQVASAIDLVVQVRRDRDGARSVAEVVEVGRRDGEYLINPLSIGNEMVGELRSRSRSHEVSA